MGARDRYSFKFQCPKCKQAGEVHISEDEYRYSPMRREIDGVDGNFNVSEAARGYSYECLSCGEKWVS